MKLFGLRFAAMLWAIAMFSTGCIGSMIEKRKAERIENDAAYRHSLGIYRVGDIYDADGKRGVVFEIDSMGNHGKIVALYETKCRWDVHTKIVWPEYFGTATGADSESDGMYNFRKVTVQDRWLEKYPAFAFCAEQGDGWYLPAYKEMCRLDSESDRLNPVLDSLNGDPLRGASYWTSSESSGATAWQYYAGSKHMDAGTHPKNEEVYVRSIAAF